MFRFFALIVLAGLCLTACQGEAPGSNERLIQAYERGEEGVLMRGNGKVGNVYGDDQLSGMEIQRFQVRINDEFAVIVQYHHEMDQRIPILNGASLSFTGVYEWRPTGGVVSVGQAGVEGTWVEYQGRRYQ